MWSLLASNELSTSYVIVVKKVIVETEFSQCVGLAITFLTFIALFQRSYIVGSRSHFESILHQGRLLNVSPKE